MKTEQAIHSFWSGFDIKAYDEYSVPDTAQLPYITYSIIYDGFDRSVTMSASVWYRSASWAAITEKTKQIIDKISFGGIQITSDEGTIWLRMGEPAYQRLGADDTEIRRTYLNIIADYIPF